MLAYEMWICVWIRSVLIVQVLREGQAIVWNNLDVKKVDYVWQLKLMDGSKYIWLRSIFVSEGWVKEERESGSNEEKIKSESSQRKENWLIISAQKIWKRSRVSTID